MCVIIEKNPGIILPEEKIINACITNSDGWGLSVIDRGKVETFFGLDDKNTDPDKVLKALEKTVNHKAFLHLRFTTAGSRSLENCHPFFTTSKTEDGVEILFMHNGTLSSFKDKENKISDTNNFNTNFLKPLIKTILKANPNENPLNNPLLSKVLEQCAGSTSVFTLYDANGDSLIINKTRGKEFEGWWASNEYSFNKSYRSQSYSNYQNYSHHNYVEDKETKNSSTSTACLVVNENAGGGNTNETSTNCSVQNNQELKTEAAALKEALKLPADSNSVKIGEYPFNPSTRDSFIELAGIPNLETLCSWTYDDIEGFVTAFPMLAQMLIIDLLYELYLKKTSDKGVH